MHGGIDPAMANKLKRNDIYHQSKLSKCHKYSAGDVKSNTKHPFLVQSPRRLE